MNKLSLINLNIRIKINNSHININKIFVWEFFMIILNKKRLILIITCVFVSIFTFMLTNFKESDIIETVNLPVSGKTIVLDAGHPRYFLTR